MAIQEGDPAPPLPPAHLEMLAKDPTLQVLTPALVATLRARRRAELMMQPLAQLLEPMEAHQVTAALARAMAPKAK